MSREWWGGSAAPGAGGLYNGESAAVPDAAHRTAAALWTWPLAPKSWVFLVSPHCCCAGGLGTAPFSFPRPGWGRLLTSYHTGKGWCTQGGQYPAEGEIRGLEDCPGASSRACLCCPGWAPGFSSSALLSTSWSQRPGFESALSSGVTLGAITRPLCASDSFSAKWDPGLLPRSGGFNGATGVRHQAQCWACSRGSEESSC